MQRHTPFGYTFVNGMPAVTEEKRELITQIFEGFAGGLSQQAIADMLTERGELNANGKPSWNHSTVGKMLSNPKYAGDDFYPAMIEKELFDRVQVEREKRNRQLGKNINFFANSGKSLYPFSRKLICSACGCIFRRYSQRLGKSNKKSVWRCKRYIVENRVCCRNTPVSDEELTVLATKILGKALSNPDLLVVKQSRGIKTSSTQVEDLNIKIMGALGAHDDQTSDTDIRDLVFKRAVAQYNSSSVDDYEYNTRKLKNLLQGYRGDSNIFDEELFKSVIKHIVVDDTGTLCFVFINDSTLTERLDMSRRG